MSESGYWNFYFSILSDLNIQDSILILLKTYEKASCLVPSFCT